MKKITPETFKETLNRVAATEDGQILLAAIKDSCQWDMTILSSDDATKTMYYASRRGIWGGIRRKIQSKYLKVIEHDIEVTADKD